MKDYIICDLDGTIANIDHRRHLVEGKHRNFDEFNRQCINDIPNEDVVNTLKAYDYSNYKIYIVSGREDVVKEQTLAWLTQNNVPYTKLIMRPAKDYIPDVELKKRWLYDGTLPKKDKILVCLDDRTRVVNMWRAEGLPCFQVRVFNN